MNVFEIITQYESLMAQIEDLGGEITPEIAQQLNINKEELEKKIKAYYYVIKSREAEIKLAKDEIERLTSVIKSKEGLIKRLKKTVDIAVEEFGEPKPSGAKGIKFDNLNVWQKKTTALCLVENSRIEDPRFGCVKYILHLDPETDKQFCEAIKDIGFMPVFGKDALVADYYLDNNSLKEWLLENEEYCKQLKDEAEDIAIGIDKFEAITTEEDRAEIKAEEKIREADRKIALAASIAHNSTVVFK